MASRRNEDELLVFALRATATHVAERCLELRCGSEDSIDSAACAYAKRSLRVRRDRLRHTMTITVELPLDTGELVEKALDKARDDEVLAVPDLADTSWSRGVCKATFTGPDGKRANGSSRWLKVWTKYSDGSWKGRINSWKFEN